MLQVIAGQTFNSIACPSFSFREIGQTAALWGRIMQVNDGGARVGRHVGQFNLHITGRMTLRLSEESVVVVPSDKS